MKDRYTAKAFDLLGQCFLDETGKIQKKQWYEG
jgi:hypothetical protein